MKHIITPNCVTVILSGMTYLVASDQPQYRPLVAACRSEDEAAVKRICFTQRRVMAVLDYFGDARMVDGVVVERGPPNRLVHNIIDNLHSQDLFTHLEEAERVLGL